MPRLSQNGKAADNATKDTLNRAGPKKVKSGCRTCKIRKVKCDENKPVCDRCFSGGRICEGYGIWGGGNRISSSHSTTQPPLVPPDCTVDPRPKKIQTSWGKGRTQTASSEKQLSVLGSIPRIIALSPMPDRERRLLYCYQSYTAPEISSLFSSELWNSLIPQASQTELAVRHATLALTMAYGYENYNAIRRKPSNQETYILKEYNKAIYYLKPHFNNVQDSRSARVILITCFLFICLEILQQHPKAAIFHLSNGLELIKQFKQKGRLLGILDHYHVSHDAIAQIFFNLSLQVQMLGYSHSYPFLIKNGHIPEKYPNSFSSLLEAGNYLHKITARAFGFTNLCREQGRLQQAPDELIDYQSTLRTDLESWLQKFISYGLEVDSINPSQDNLTTMAMRMYHAMTVIMIETSLFADQETIFDCYSADFISIIAYAVKITQSVKKLQKNIDDIQTDVFVFNTGWISVLFYTAIKCRIRRIRLHAIRFIEETHHKIWDFSATGRAAREVMRIEEEGNESIHTCTDEDFALDHIPSQEELIVSPLSESQRVRDVDLILPEDTLGRGILKCRRRLSNGHYENILREYNPISKTWFDIGH